MEQVSQKGLVRGIGRWDLLALTINGMVGAGIFGLPSRIYGLAGVWSVVAYLVCAALVTLITLCFAEVGSRFAETGGPYLYARMAFGSVIGFEVGWLVWLARVTAFAALCNLLLGYLSFFWPAAGSGLTRALVITVVVIAMTTVNLIGVREAALVNNLFTIAKLTPLLLFIVAGLFFLSPETFIAPAAPNYGDFSTAALLLIFAFSGFEMAVVPAGETRDPRRHVAFALLTATGVVALLYVMIQVVCIGTLPGLASSERPLVDASSRFLGATGASIVSVGALISITGTLNSNMLVAPRILFAMAEQGQLPRPLAATHRRFRTPHIAILISAAVTFVLTLQGTFISALTISTVIRLLVYIATCVALPVLRFRKDAPAPRFNAPAGAAVAVAAATLSMWLLSNSPSNDARAVGLAAALGLPIFFAYRLLKKPPISAGESDSISAS
ncbi:MAG TPA: amino acid permease [Blastocatellia bacterium]|nr:amino acid permease [Blastocatellia bacterium]